MRLTVYNPERCNEQTTYILSCIWDHAYDMMRREPEQFFLVDS